MRHHYAVAPRHFSFSRKERKSHFSTTATTTIFSPNYTLLLYTALQWCGIGNFFRGKKKPVIKSITTQKKPQIIDRCVSFALILTHRFLPHILSQKCRRPSDRAFEPAQHHALICHLMWPISCLPG